MPLDMQYQPWRSRPQRSTCKCDVQALVTASQTRAPAFTTMVENINRDLLRLDGLDVPRVNEILIKHSCSAFASRHTRTDPPHLNPQVQGVVRKHHGSNCFVAILGGVVLQFLALASGRPRPVQDATAG